MNRYHISLFAIVALLGLASCSGEDDLQPSHADTNFFLPNSDDNGQEAELRRSFFDANQCYLVFNDTLRHELSGTDANGNPTYETVMLEVPYRMTSSISYANKYSYLPTYTDKQLAAQFIEQYLLGHLSVQLRPYCWLAVGHITTYSVSSGVYTYSSEPSFYTGDQATALALEGLSDMTDEEKSSLAADILASTMASKVSAQTSDVLSEFTSISASLYGTYVDSSHYAWDEEGNLLNMYSAGFVTGHYYDIWLLYNSYPSQDEDVRSFVRLVLTSTEAEVNETFSAYPTIINKYNIMKKIILNLGYIF